MKIRITSNPITTKGSFSRGQILTSDQYSAAFLCHLVDVGAAERLEYETKVDDGYQVKKKSRSLPSSGPGNHSPVTTASLPPIKQRL